MYSDNRWDLVTAGRVYTKEQRAAARAHKAFARRVALLCSAGLHRATARTYVLLDVAHPLTSPTVAEPESYGLVKPDAYKSVAR